MWYQGYIITKHGLMNIEKPSFLSPLIYIYIYSAPLMCVQFQTWNPKLFGEGEKRGGAKERERERAGLWGRDAM